MGAEQSTARNVREEEQRLRMGERKAYEAKLEKQRQETYRLLMEEKKAYEAKLEKQSRELAEQRAKVLLEQQKNNYYLKSKGVDTQPAPYSVTLSTSSHHGNQEGYQAKPTEWYSKCYPVSPPVNNKPAVVSSSVTLSTSSHHGNQEGYQAKPTECYSKLYLPPPVSYKPAVVSSRCYPVSPPVNNKPAVVSSRWTPPAPPVSHKPAEWSSMWNLPANYEPAPPVSHKPAEGSSSFMWNLPANYEPAPPVSHKPAEGSSIWTPYAPPVSYKPAVGASSSGTKHILDELLKCRICYDKISGLTVFQCRFGHSACEKCKYENCGACGSPITEKKNTATIAIEAVKTKVTVLCTWQASGCKLVLQSNDLDSHVKGCPFRDIPCPISAILECSWQGNKSQLASHFQECHHQHCKRDAGTEMYLFNVDKSSQVINLVTLDLCHFLVLVKVDNVQGRLHMAVQLIGTMADAGQYTYEFHVYNKNEPNRKFLLTDVCRSIYTPMDETFHETKTVSIPLSYATTFVNNNRVCYKLYIQKTDGETPRKARRRYGNNTAKGPNRNQN